MRTQKKLISAVRNCNDDACCDASQASTLIGVLSMVTGIGCSLPKKGGRARAHQAGEAEQEIEVMAKMVNETLRNEACVDSRTSGRECVAVRTARELDVLRRHRCLGRRRGDGRCDRDVGKYSMPKKTLRAGSKKVNRRHGEQKNQKECDALERPRRKYWRRQSGRAATKACASCSNTG